MIKKLAIFIFIVSLAGIIVSSCSRCITCQIIGHSINETFTDNDTVNYNEFCGTPSEVKAFEDDVKWEAESRRCVLYTIQTIHDQTILYHTFVCGGIKEQEQMANYIDSIFLSDFQPQYDEIVIDSIIPNPGTWKCD
jgi:hypothetical protein